MALSTNDMDRAVLQLAETLLRTAMTEGLDASQADALLTPAQYNPSDPPGYENRVRDTNRIIAAGVLQALRSLPVQLPTYNVASVPPAASWVGCLIYVSNGAAGSPVVAFSNGSGWLRVDTLAAIS